MTARNQLPGCGKEVDGLLKSGLDIAPCNATPMTDVTDEIPHKHNYKYSDFDRWLLIPGDDIFHSNNAMTFETAVLCISNTPAGKVQMDIRPRQVCNEMTHESMKKRQIKGGFPYG